MSELYGRNPELDYDHVQPETPEKTSDEPLRIVSRIKIIDEVVERAETADQESPNAA